jgi:hypothetical protein
VDKCRGGPGQPAFSAVAAFGWTHGGSFRGERGYPHNNIAVPTSYPQLGITLPCRAGGLRQVPQTGRFQGQGAKKRALDPVNNLVDIGEVCRHQDRGSQEPRRMAVFEPSGLLRRRNGPGATTTPGSASKGPARARGEPRSCPLNHRAIPRSYPQLWRSVPLLRGGPSNLPAVAAESAFGT